MAATIAAELDPKKFDRMLCSTRPETAPTRRADLEEAGVELLFLQRRSKVSLGAWAPLVSLLRSGRVDVLHSHKFGSNLWGTILGRVTRVPVVIAHEHSWSYSGHPLRRFLDRHVIARGVDAFIAVSREDRRRMIEIEGISPEVIRFIPNGIPPLPEPKGDLRRELGIEQGAPVVGAVGQLREEKNFDVLIRAVATAVQRLPGLRLVIAGDGPEAGNLRRLVSELRLADVVILAGLRRDIPEVLATFDVAVCCSSREGSPLSVMEYMAAGKPVVASRVGGIPDLIDDGVHGLLVEPGRADPLAEALERLLAAPEDRRSMGRRGRERQAQEFDLGVMVRRVQDLYQELYRRKARTVAE